MPNLNTQNEEKTKKADKFLHHYFYLVVIGVVLLIFFAGYFFLLFPKYSQGLINIEKHEARNNDVISQLNLFQRKANEFNDYFDNISENDYLKSKKLVIEDNNFDSLYSMLELMVSEKGLDLESLSITKNEMQNERRREVVKDESNEESAVPADVDIINITMNVGNVNYVSLKTLLSSIENNIPIFDVQSVKYETAARKLTLELNTYIYIINKSI